MPYSAVEARRRLLDDLAAAADQLAIALACVAEAYDELDEQTADALERELFRPLQGAYGRAQRTHAEFAARQRLPGRSFEPRSAGTHTADPRVYIERAIAAAQRADEELVAIQDSMMPVEVGDAELRAGMSRVREQIAQLPARGRQLLRTLGR